MPRTMFTYVVAMPRHSGNFDRRMSASRRPSGIASGNATATMAIDMKKPERTTGKLEHAI